MIDRIRLVWFALVIATALVGCVSDTQEPPTPSPVPKTSTPIPPTSTLPPPTSTLALNETEAGLLQLTFDGKSCTYEGPTTLKARLVALLFLNESEGNAALNLVRHLGGHTIQDMIDTFVEEPSTEHHPAWSVEVGAWYPIRAGESHLWEGDLEPGIHTMVCANLSQFGVWFGTGLTVED